MVELTWIVTFGLIALAGVFIFRYFPLFFDSFVNTFFKLIGVGGKVAANLGGITDLGKSFSAEKNALGEIQNEEKKIEQLIVGDLKGYKIGQELIKKLIEGRGVEADLKALSIYFQKAIEKIKRNIAFFESELKIIQANTHQHTIDLGSLKSEMVKIADAASKKGEAGKTIIAAAGQKVDQVNILKNAVLQDNEVLVEAHEKLKGEAVEIGKGYVVCMQLLNQKSKEAYLQIKKIHDTIGRKFVEQYQEIEQILVLTSKMNKEQDEAQNLFKELQGIEHLKAAA